jgi:hypothetical protein
MHRNRLAKLSRNLSPDTNLALSSHQTIHCRTSAPSSYRRSPSNRQAKIMLPGASILVAVGFLLANQVSCRTADAAHAALSGSFLSGGFATRREGRHGNVFSACAYCCGRSAARRYACGSGVPPCSHRRKSRNADEWHPARHHHARMRISDDARGMSSASGHQTITIVRGIRAPEGRALPNPGGSLPA